MKKWVHFGSTWIEFINWAITSWGHYAQSPIVSLTVWHCYLVCREYPHSIPSHIIRTKANRWPGTPPGRTTAYLAYDTSHMNSPAEFRLACAHLPQISHRRILSVGLLEMSTCPLSERMRSHALPNNHNSFPVSFSSCPPPLLSPATVLRQISRINQSDSRPSIRPSNLTGEKWGYTIFRRSLMHEISFKLRVCCYYYYYDDGR